MPTFVQALYPKHQLTPAIDGISPLLPLSMLVDKLACRHLSRLTLGALDSTTPTPNHLIIFRHSLAPQPTHVLVQTWALSVTVRSATSLTHLVSSSATFSPSHADSIPS